MERRQIMTWALISGVLAAAFVGQSLLKAGVNRVGTLRFESIGAVVSFYAACLKSPFVLLGVLVVGIGFALWMALLSRADLSEALPLLGLAYIPWLFIGRFAFHEQITAQRVVGVLMIAAGVLLVGRR
jgi:drug/metabolite transporter (DMT)-like permease